MKQRRFWGIRVRTVRDKRYALDEVFRGQHAVNGLNQGMRKGQDKPCSSLWSLLVDDTLFSINHT